MSWLVDIIWQAACLFGFVDICLLVERLMHRIQEHRGACPRCYDRARRRAARRWARRALETPHLSRAWPLAPTGTSGDRVPVGAPPTPVGARS